MKCLLLLLLSLTSFCGAFFVHPKIIPDFLRCFNLSHGIVFFCNATEINDLMNLAKSELKFCSFVDISSHKHNSGFYRSVMRISYRQLGIVFDSTCKKTEKVFEDFSQLNFFNASYNWLIKTEDYGEALKMLSNKNINLDAEISLAVSSGNEEVKLYDIFNPNSRTNGKIVSQPKGTWSEIDGMKISFKEGKFERRSNLNNVYINAGVVASSAFMGNQTLTQYLESK